MDSSLASSGSPATSPNSVSPKNLILQDGTPVLLRLKRTISSADSHVGDTVDFEVIQEIRVNETTVIRKGTLAFGTVTEVLPTRNMARGGKLKVRIDYVNLLNGEKAGLRAVQGGKGGSHARAMTVGIVTAGVLFFPAAPPFLLMHGKDMVLAKGSEVTAYVDNDRKLESVNFEDLNRAGVEPNANSTEHLSKQTPPPGSFQRNTYANEVLRLYYPLRQQWTFETDLIRKRLASTNQPESQNLLLAAVQIPQDITDLRRESSLLVLALPRSAQGDARSCRQYLDGLVSTLRATKVADQKDEISEYSVAGHDFSRVNLEYRSGISDRAMICGATEDYLLIWKVEGSRWHFVDEAASTVYAIVPWPSERERESSQRFTQVDLSPSAAAKLRVKKVRAIYPAEARENRIEGAIRLRATINEAGEVSNLELLDGPIELTASAVVAVRQWKYRPYLVNGKPVPISTEIVLNYKAPPGVSP